MPIFVDDMVPRVAKIARITEDAARDFCRRFSLPSLRASVGALGYLETGSLQGFCDAMGHAEVNFRLLEKYLPRPILDFFQERWIRIFQAGLVVEALKNSPYLVEASGFHSMEQVHEFLSHHALKIPRPTERVDAEPAIGPEPEVVFGVNEEILTLLISLQRSVDAASEPASPRAQWWADISRRLTEFIAAPDFDRDDIKSYLQNAQRRAAADLTSNLIYD